MAPETAPAPGGTGPASWRDALPSAPQFEVIPLAGVDEQVDRHLPPGSRVTVTSSPAQGAEATFTLARTLARQGFTAIPHLAARQMPDAAQLRDVLAGLQEDGVGEVFVIAGDAPEPAGEFSGALALLEAIDRLGTDLTIGVGAHPEGHPYVDQEEALRLLATKAQYASSIVTQMCFEAPPLRAWLEQIRARGITLPVRPGVPGPTGVGRLLKIGSRVGVGRSLRMLSQHGPGMRKLVGPGIWRPDELLDELAPDFSDPGIGLDGPHVYTFNGLERVGQWWSGQ